MMTTAKLNTQHDYLSVRAKFSPTVNANLTFSRYGMKLSGKGLTIDQMKALLAPFDKLRQRMEKKELPQFTNPGVMMEAVRLMAEQSATVEDFVAAMTAVAKS